MVRTSFSSIKRKGIEWGRYIEGAKLMKRQVAQLPSMVSSGSSSKGMGLRGRLMAFIPSSWSSDTERQGRTGHILA
jgi:hypothetical protein